METTRLSFFVVETNTTTERMTRTLMMRLLTVFLCVSCLTCVVAFHSTLERSTTRRSLPLSPQRQSSRVFRTSFPQLSGSPKSFRRSLLLSASSPTQSNDNNDKPNQNNNNPLTRMVVQLVALKTVLWRRLVSLNRRAKRILALQVVVITIVFGGMTAQKARAPPPVPLVEISYSSFLDLVDLQHTIGNNQVPRMDQVRIAPDRIHYRLYTTPDSEPVIPVPTTKAQKTTTTSRNRRLSKQKQSTQQSPPYIRAYTRKVAAAPELVSQLRSSQVPFSAALETRKNTAAMTIRAVVVTFYFVILWRLYQSVSGGAGGGSRSQDTPGKLAKRGAGSFQSDLPLTSFDDIAGMDGPKMQVMELVDTLRNPTKYAALGARAPTGLLLEGPPGTGKTMLARATAASAGIPLIYCSGSDFVEMYVGRGAARVRNLFQRAEKLAPCILFIDELDALGKSRDMNNMPGMPPGRSNDEAEQTLNQLLACMDGLDSSKRVCVLAATNRKSVLDPALVRPGRFDRLVELTLPDAAGREAILRVHTRRLPGFVEGTGVDPDRPGALGQGAKVDLSAVAAVTDGLSGAELQVVVNEAAICAVRRVSLGNAVPPHVDATDFESSLAHFYESRPPKRGVEDLWKNVWR